MSESPKGTDVGVELHDVDDGRLVRICYVLSLLGWILGITAWVALIMAYFGKSRGPPWVQGHYRFILRTFWLPVVGFVIVTLLWPLIASVSQALANATLFLGMALTFLWMVFRKVKGLKRVNKGLPISNPNSLMFGD